MLLDSESFILHTGNRFFSHLNLWLMIYNFPHFVRHRRGRRRRRRWHTATWRRARATDWWVDSYGHSDRVPRDRRNCLIFPPLVVWHLYNDGPTSKTLADIVQMLYNKQGTQGQEKLFKIFPVGKHREFYNFVKYNVQENTGNCIWWEYLLSLQKMSRLRMLGQNIEKFLTIIMQFTDFYSLNIHMYTLLYISWLDWKSWRRPHIDI